MDVDECDSKTLASGDVPKLPRDNTVECAICLQPFVQPVQLPCSHTFCFLCAKGIALQRRPCALCRSDIPLDFLTKPSQFQAKSSKSIRGNLDSDRHVWYYAGHKGWWQYDERTSIDIEDAFMKKEKTVDILIAGAIYVIDFENMIQYQRFTNSRKRKIKRDKLSAEKKGVAGMTLPTDSAPDISGTAVTVPAGNTTPTRHSPFGGSDDSASTPDAQSHSTGNSASAVN